jgi:hypothetical protein
VLFRSGINSSGILVGSDIIAGAPTTRPGFTYDIATGTRTDVAIAGASRTALRAIDDSGNVAGWFTDGGGAIHGFVGSVSAYDQIDVAGATSTFVEGSNNGGTLVGNFLTASGGGAFIVNRVPEPGTLALMTVALLALGATRRTARA